jgi:hypothetical protein
MRGSRAAAGRALRAAGPGSGQRGAPSAVERAGATGPFASTPRASSTRAAVASRRRSSLHQRYALPSASVSSSTRRRSGRAPRACAKNERQVASTTPAASPAGGPSSQLPNSTVQQTAPAPASAAGSRTAVSEKPKSAHGTAASQRNSVGLSGSRSSLNRGQSQWLATISWTMPTSRASSLFTMAASPRSCSARSRKAPARSTPLTRGSRRRRRYHGNGPSTRLHDRVRLLPASQAGPGRARASGPTGATSLDRDTVRS